MNLLELKASFCRAVWTGPLATEAGAPEHRVIHVLGLRDPGPLRLDRLEQDARRYSRLVWLIVGSAATAFASVLVAWATG